MTTQMRYSNPKSVCKRMLALATLCGLAACGSSDAPTSASTDAEPPIATGSTASTAPAGSKASASTANSPPEIGRVWFEPEEPVAGESIRALVEASDPEGDSIWIEYAWKIEGEVVKGDKSRLLLRGARKGQTVEVFVTARDGQGSSDSRRESTEIRNAPPRLSRIRVEPSNEIIAGTPIVVRPEAIDSDGDGLSFEYTWKVNDALVRESGPRLDTARLRRGDRVNVVVSAFDGQDQSEPMSVPELLIVNAPPRILEIFSEPRVTGEFHYRVKAEDPDGDLGLQFELDDPPDGMAIDALSGLITWTPATDQVGIHSVAVIVDDLHGGRSRQSIEVTVRAPAVSAQAPARVR